ncbi:restriction endonuclease subunit S [Micromonospora sp. NPDC049679]|uniref:restriction endonuclease subunit S n=1 Tax=Micromonospora sp. NPDC049679 TaxID=3155920 RepID=UPI0033E4F05E
MIGMPWPLPSDWRWAAFKDVARVVSHLVDPALYPDAPHVAPNHIEGGTGRLLPFRTIAADGVKSPKHRFQTGQVIYSKIRPYLAKVIVADFDGLCSADMYPVATDLDPRFLKWWMLTPEFTRRAAGEQARTVLPKINRRALEKLPIPVPPQAVQRQIVDILEDHLSRLGAANDYINAARARAELLTTSALLADESMASSPRLTLREVLAEPLSNGRSVPTREGGFPVLRLTALQQERVDLNERKGGAWTLDEARPFLVQQGDFLVARGNGSLRLVARGALVQEKPDPVAYPDTLIRVRMDPKRTNPSFLSLVWNSPVVRRQVESMARTTAGIYKVNQKHLETVVLPVPTLDEQAQICARVEHVRVAQRRLTEICTTSTIRSSALRRATLTAAFSGRLTGRARDLEIVEEMAGV